MVGRHKMPYVELSIDQGADFETSIDLVSDDENPIDIDGYTFVGQIRKSYYSANPTANIEISINTEVAGNLVLSLDSSTTANINSGRYVYDVFMTDTSNTVTRIIEGIVTVTPAVTR
jgi:hypothetical protein